jgi:two-component system chemotaxis response regulator CheB
MTLRVLCVDDSSAIRVALHMVLSRTPGVTVVGSARSGEEAVGLVRTLRPDLVILDMVMPGLDGLETWGRCQAADPDLQALILTASDPKPIRDRLSRGSGRTVPVLRKPEGASDFMQWYLQELRPFIESTFPIRPPGQPIAKPGDPSGPFSVILLAASTGGPDAIRAVLESLPVEVGLPVLIVQHMPATFVPVFAENLSRKLSWQVVEAEQGDVPRPGRAYVAGKGLHLEVRASPTGVHLVQTDSEPLHGCRPAADRLLLSAAATWGNHTLAAVLTGMGRDGAAGAQAIRERGGHVIAQDQQTSTVWGMPGSVVALGAAHEILPLNEIGPALAKVVKFRGNLRP